MAQTASGDGRNMRRERSRRAVIDAAFELVEEGKVPPSVETVAERAGVSVSSIFRNFDGLADMQHQAIELSFEKYGSKYVVADADAPQAERIRSHVRDRIEFYESAGPLLRLARGRAIDHEPLVDAVARLRGRLADLTRQRFATEVKALTPATAAELVATLDTITSPEVYELLSAAHARSSRQITRAWVATITALLNPLDLKENA